MAPQEKYELLIDEIEGFIEDEAIAIRQDNWAYLADLLRKKEGHLRAIMDLKSQVNEHQGDLPHRIERIKAKEAIAAGLMAEKMNEAKEEQAHILETKRRISQVRELVQLQGYQILGRVGGLKASA